MSKKKNNNQIQIISKKFWKNKKHKEKKLRNKKTNILVDHFGNTWWVCVVTMTNMKRNQNVCWNWIFIYLYHFTIFFFLKKKDEKHFEKIQNDHQAHMDRIRNHHRLIQEQQRQHQQKQHHRFGHRHEL